MLNYHYIWWLMHLSITLRNNCAKHAGAAACWENEIVLTCSYIYMNENEAGVRLAERLKKSSLIKSGQTSRQHVQNKRADIRRIVSLRTWATPYLKHPAKSEYSPEFIMKSDRHTSLMRRSHVYEASAFLTCKRKRHSTQRCETHWVFFSWLLMCEEMLVILRVNVKIIL